MHQANWTIFRFCHIRKEGNVLFKDALNIFYIWLYGVGHVIRCVLSSQLIPITINYLDNKLSSA